MANPTTTQGEQTPAATRDQIAGTGGILADLLMSLDNGVRVTGLVLMVDPPKEFKGTSKGGNPYAFAVREIQIFTGNKTVTCKDQRDVGGSFPLIAVGSKATFKVKGIRMNGTVPIFELDTEG